MHQYVLYPMTKGDQYKSVCFILQQVFDSISKNPDDVSKLSDKFEQLKNIFKQQNPIDTSFDKDMFDDHFAKFWNDLRILKIGKTTYDEMYKEAFTIKALSSLKVINHWKFIQKGDEQYFYHEKPDYPRTYTHAPGTTIEHFFVENKSQVENVLRVCFGAHILSSCILQFDIRGKQPVIVEEPYYQEFRQTPRYVHSTYVERINHLTEDQLKRSSHDIRSLHSKLKTILDTDKELTFVAHNAQQDRKWILQSIMDQIDYHEYESCQTGVNHKQEIEALKDLYNRLQLAKWFCTIHGTLKPDGKSVGKHDGSKHKIQQPEESNTLSAVYQKITGDPLKNQHDARTDTYACALIFCRLFKLDQTESSDYNRIRLLCSGSDASQRSTKIRKIRSLAEIGRSNASVYTIPRQYDIYIDGQKLPADYVTDKNTQVGETIHLEFGGPDHHENRLDLVDFNQNGDTHIIRSHHCREGDERAGNLGGAYITFRLKDDAFGRRVEICTGTEYLVWRVLDNNTHNLDEDLPHLRQDPLRLDAHTIYEIRELTTQETILLKVIDLHPTHTPSTAQLPSTKQLLTILYRLCL
jgi:DNA polymerase III epsilon subunit-like protein